MKSVRCNVSCWLACVWAIGLIWMGCARGVESEEPYSVGLQRFRSGEFAEAAQIWSAAADDALKGKHDSGALKRAGLNQVLATLAYERAEDSRAYQAWADAVRYFLEAGTNWDEQRTEISRRLHQQARTLIQADVAPPRVPPFDLILTQIDQVTQLLTYDGPKAGLHASEEEQPPVGVSLQYFPGAAMSGSESAPVAQESRDRAVPSDVSDTDETTARLGGRALRSTSPSSGSFVL